MKFSFYVGLNDTGELTIQRERDDQRAKASSFTANVHGWGAEIHLLGMVRNELNKFGFNLSRIKVSRDGHMMGDDHMCYLRPPKTDLRKSESSFPYIYIFDGGYAVRNSAEDYNAYKEVKFQIVGNVFTDYPQSDWENKLRRLCEQSEIPFHKFGENTR